MFKHILIPVDGSETSTRALDKAVALAKAFQSDVTAIYVIDPYPFSGVGADFAYGQSQYLGAATAEANAALDAARSTLEAAGLPVKTTVVEAHAIHRGILDTAQNLGTDLIVMGSHGRRGIEKLVLGSVAQKVLSDAHLAVLVVRD
ncbi:universal stress protein [Curvibacter sp. HBC61]|uniref:Universal stress protein n=1 Tax=Curvibacter cyanobacteriorum TaxID=3026422 RepID=A0ABT5MU33_9BURK|nr:universal stress protein [Curvibacter sp. HBC61]MDD0837313.1 universal stress protein [Curvibacter sp. HBC61]